jgi:hypothetical protein
MFLPTKFKWVVPTLYNVNDFAWNVYSNRVTLNVSDDTICELYIVYGI